MAELVQPGGGGSSLEVSDGSTSVFNVSEILFTGATVSNGGAGTADVLISASATSITVGSTLVGSASDKYILYNNAGTLGQYSITGTGTAVVLATSPTFQTSINGAYLTASTILITDSSSNIISATTATYPSLTELSYVKGVTSAIQTQINAKGAGTVTAVSIATANGFSGTSSGGSTPALTIVAGAITPTSVNSVVISGSATPTLAVAGTTTVSGTNTGDQTSVSGNAGTATALATGRTISITGDLAYTSPSFDGSGNVTAAGTLATVNSNVGSFGSATQVGTFTVNGKGLVTAAGSTTITPAIGSITGLGTGVATFLATPTSANLASAITDETGSGALMFGTDPALTVSTPTTTSVGYLGIPQNSKSAAYTTVMADSGKHIFHPAADTSARTWTIDSNANVAYPIGTTLTFINETSAGVITIAITSDTLLFAGAATTGSRTLAASNIATATKITSTKWIITGSSGLT